MIYIYVYIYIYMCVYACIYIYIYMYTDIHYPIKCSLTPPGSAGWLISSMRMVSPLKVRPWHRNASLEVGTLSLYLLRIWIPSIYLPRLSIYLSVCPSVCLSIYLFLSLRVYTSHFLVNNNWLVVSTPLKNISQWEGLSHIFWNIKNG